jgi:ribonuclease HI
MRSQSDGEILFDPTAMAKNHLLECFHIFIDPDRVIQIPTYRLHTPITTRRAIEEPLMIYMDGSCTNNGKYNAICESGIWINKNHHLNQAIRVPGPTQSNQAAEIAAVLTALQAVNPFTPIKIVTDSKYVIKGLTTHLEQWEDSRWIGISNADLFKATIYHLRHHPALTTFQWVKGHEGNIGNEQADKLALSGTRHNEPDILDIYVPKNIDLQGAKLSKITQNLAYKAITEKTHLAYNRTTHGLLNITRFVIESLSHQLETNEAVWKSCRQKDITKKIQMYLYKSLNNAYRIGECTLA